MTALFDGLLVFILSQLGGGLSPFIFPTAPFSFSGHFGKTMNLGEAIEAKRKTVRRSGVPCNLTIACQVIRGLTPQGGKHENSENFLFDYL